MWIECLCRSLFDVGFLLLLLIFFWLICILWFSQIRCYHSLQHNSSPVVRDPSSQGKFKNKFNFFCLWIFFSFSHSMNSNSNLVFDFEFQILCSISWIFPILDFKTFSFGIRNFYFSERFIVVLEIIHLPSCYIDLIQTSIKLLFHWHKKFLRKNNVFSFYFSCLHFFW